MILRKRRRREFDLFRRVSHDALLLDPTGGVGDDPYREEVSMMFWCSRVCSTRRDATVLT